MGVLRPHLRGAVRLLESSRARIPHVITVFAENGVTHVKAAQAAGESGCLLLASAYFAIVPVLECADISKNQLIEEDKRYRREVAKKNAAKAFKT